MTQLTQALAQSPATDSQLATLDLTRYFQNAEAEALDLQVCQSDASALDNIHPTGPASLLGFLKQSDAVLGRLRRHTAYWKAIALRDAEDPRPAQRSRATRMVRIQVFDIVSRELTAYGNARFETDAKTTPGLLRYADLVRDSADEASHRLPAAEESLLGQLGGAAQASYWAMYQQLERTAPFGKIQTSQGERDVYVDASLLALDGDSAVRRQAWQAYWNAYAQRQDLFATTLLSVVRLRDQRARLHHYRNAPNERYAEAQLSQDDVNQAFAQVRTFGALLKRYQRLRSQRVAHEYGIGDVHVWDSHLPARTVTAPRLTLDQTRVAALAALQPLGADYVEHFRALLDPANGRLDVAQTKGHRGSDNTSISAPGVPSGLFIEVYNSGLMDQSDVIIHEGGHSIHNQYMNEAGVSNYAIDGPGWVAEAIAHLNGYLLYDYLAKTAPDTATKAYYLQGYLDKLALEIFGSAEEGLLEQTIYEGVAAGSIKNAADLNALTRKVWNEFEIWPEKDTALQYSWMSRRLFFNDPLYYFNYLFAGALSIKMVGMAQTDAADFQPRYMQLLRGGFSENSNTLLRQFFGKDVSHGELVQDAMRSFEKKLDELERTYQAMDAAAPK